MMMRVSLKIKLIGVMVVILGATLSVSYLILDRNEGELLQQVVQHVKALENVGNVLEIQQILTTHDRTRQHQLFVRMNQLGRVSQVSLLDLNYRVVASSAQNDVGLTLAELERRRISPVGASFWDRLLSQHLNAYDVTFPIYENGRKSGYLNVMLVLNDLEYLIKKAKYSNILSILLIVLSGAAAAIYLVHRFTRPIDALVTASKAVAEGNFETTVNMRSSGELATLIAGFNEMTEKLREHHALEERFHRSERMAALG